MRRLLRLSGLLLGLAASAYFLAFAYRAAAGFDARSLGTLPTVLAIAFASIAYASVIPTSSWAWGRLLRSIGVPFPTLELNAILGTSQIAKYVPGNVGQHLGRLAIAVERGVPASAVLLTLLAETLLAVAAALVVGVLALAIAGRGPAAVTVGHPKGIAFLALFLAVLLAGLLPAVRRSLVRQRWLAPYLAAARPAEAGARRALGVAFLCYLVNHVVVGLGLCGIAFAAGQLSPSTVFLFVGAFALSWVAGFVVPGAPAGLGVREGVLAALLAPPLEGGAALRIIVAFRVATTLGDLVGLAWGAGLWLAGRAAPARGAVDSGGRRE